MSAFTLIELLVVVAIIGLLISILLPSLRTAREQARQVKCIANLRSIGGAMHMYFGDEKDWFPFEREPFPGGVWPASAFFYGGHPGRPFPPGDSRRNPLWDNQAHRYSFAGKPFNRYMFSNLRRDVEKNNEVGTGPFEEARNQMDIYACPSDVGGYYNTDSQDDFDQIIPTHYTQGASYDINYHFVWLWAAGRGFGSTPRPYTRGARERVQYLQLANRFLQVQRREWPDRFVVLYEDVFDSSLYERVQKLGWHRKYNRHSLLFLDGHANHMTANPEKDGTLGTGWKTSSGDWYNRPKDPDYPYRDLSP